MIIFINQLRREDRASCTANLEPTTGGNALKFYCSVRLDIRRKRAIKRGEETIGSEVKVKVVKNKRAAVPGGGVRDPVRHGASTASASWSTPQRSSG